MGGTTTTTLPPGGTTTTTLPPGGTTTTTTITTTAKPIVKCSELANPYSSATCCREDVCCVGGTCCASDAGNLVVVGTHCCLGDGCCALKGEKDCCNDKESCCATGCFEHCKIIQDDGEEGFLDNLRQSTTDDSDCGCRQGVKESKCEMLDERDAPACHKYEECICGSGDGTCTIGKCKITQCPTRARNSFARYLAQ